MKSHEKSLKFEVTYSFFFPAHDPPTSMFNYRTDPEGMLHGHNKLTRLTHYRIPHFSVPRFSRPTPRGD